MSTEFIDDTHDKKRLRQEIIRMSIADDWDQAKQEWVFVGVTYEDDGHCLCGKRIKEHCHIFNEQTFTETHVGNECIKHFTGVFAQADYTKEIFQAIKKLKSNRYAHPGGHLTRVAYDSGWIRPNDIRFLVGTERRTLSAAQQRWIGDINKRIVHGLTTEPFKYKPKPKRRSNAL
jgi:hypothetical protein